MAPSSDPPSVCGIVWAWVDATTVARQAAADADTAPLFSAAEILAAGRRIEPDVAEDARALRLRLELSQEAFAARFGFTVDAIRQYESDRRTPTGPARTCSGLVLGFCAALRR